MDSRGWLVGIFLGVARGYQGWLEWGLEVEGSCWFVQIVLCCMQVLVAVKLASLISCQSISCTKSELNKTKFQSVLSLAWLARPQLVLNIYRKRFNFDYNQDTWVLIPNYLGRYLIKSNYSQNYDDGADLCQFCVIIRSQY